MYRAGTVLWVALCLSGAMAHAEIRIAGDTAFRAAVTAQIDSLRASDAPVLRKLIEVVSACPAMVEIRPMTDDPSTWHEDGSRDRGHADPADRKPKRLGRDRPTDSWLYIPPSAVQPQSRLWKSGVFVHELTHSMDLSCGRYHREGSVRERRAVWVQNYWRHRLGGVALRDDYHGQFATIDFQEGLRKRALAEYEPFLFTRSDFPQPPR